MHSTKKAEALLQVEGMTYNPTTGRRRSLNNVFQRKHSLPSSYSAARHMMQNTLPQREVQVGSVAEGHVLSTTASQTASAANLSASAANLSASMTTKGLKTIHL